MPKVSNRKRKGFTLGVVQYIDRQHYCPWNLQNVKEYHEFSSWIIWNWSGIGLELVWNWGSFTQRFGNLDFLSIRGAPGQRQRQM
jgi:hypothetical protein